MLYQSSSRSQAALPSAGRRVSHKKRRLGETDTLITTLSNTLTSGVPLTTPSTHSATCSSCHRAIRGLFAQSIQCARCSQEVCSICTRTCVGWPSSVALPITTGSLNLPRHHVRKRSPLNATQINTVASASVSGKRRKPLTLDEDEEDGRTDESKPDLVVGCSQTVCRNCCYEAPNSEASMCHDCRDSAQAALREETTKDDVVRMIEV